MKASAPPEADSIEELARFWDSHDVTEFEGQLEEVGEPALERPTPRVSAADGGTGHPLQARAREFRRVMKRLEKARQPSYTAPEWCFKKAQRKVQSGDYDPDPQPKQ